MRLAAVFCAFGAENHGDFGRLLRSGKRRIHEYSAACHALQATKLAMVFSFDPNAQNGWHSSHRLSAGRDD